jgi:hypothetical protein
MNIAETFEGRVIVLTVVMLGAGATSAFAQLFEADSGSGNILEFTPTGIARLKKFLYYGYPEGRPPVKFAQYTGQEKDEQRKAIIANGMPLEYRCVLAPHREQGAIRLLFRVPAISGL